VQTNRTTNRAANRAAQQRTGLSRIEVAILRLEAARPADDRRARADLAETLFGPAGPSPARSRPMIRYLQVLSALRDHPAAEERFPVVVARLRAEAARRPAVKARRA
jgi:hypothetical protein